MARTKSNELPEQFGTARRFDGVENKTEAWHELRKAGIGGSEVASVVGCSPWKSAVTLWAEKTDLIEREVVANDAVEWGIRLEPVILEKFAENHPELTLYTDVGSWFHEDRPWQISNPDAIAVDADGNGYIIEIKTASYEDDWKSGGEWQVPAYYQTQVQWYLQTFGFAKAYVGVLFAGRKYVEIEVEASRFLQDMNLDTAYEFRQCVLDEVQPEYDGSASTVETVRKMNPELDGSEVELGELGTYYQLALAESAKAESHLNEMKSRVLAAMASAKRGTIDGVTIVTRQSRAGGLPYLVNKKG